MDFTLGLLLAGWLFVLIWIPIVIASNRKTHPKALFVLFFAEMWERFSYYGMRALLVLYMTKVLFKELQDGEIQALGIYGAYTAMVYLFPVVGGLIADRIFGFRKAVVLGGVLMMLGHFSLALEGMVFGGNMNLFFLSLALIIVGNGYFKPNLAGFLGAFYSQDDPRKDGAFTIYYMGVNIGAFLSSLTCGYVGENISWHYGFGLAGIGMFFGLIMFTLAQKAFEDKGYAPDPEKAKTAIVAGLSPTMLVYIGTLILIPVVALFLNTSDVLSHILKIASLLVIAYMVVDGARNPDKAEGQRLWVVCVLFFFHAVFWALFEQAGGSLTLFTLKNVDRTIGNAEIPASIFQSLNPLFIMILAPLFSWAWIKLRKADIEPSTPMKFVLGLAQLALGFGVIVAGIRMFANDDGMVSMVFLTLMYLFHTTGELSLSPVGLSMITKLSPKRIVGFVMGAWFLSISLANDMAAQIGKLTAVENGAVESSDALATLATYGDAYLLWGVGVVGGAAVVLLMLVPLLKKWMHGIH